MSNGSNVAISREVFWQINKPSAQLQGSCNLAWDVNSRYLNAKILKQENKIVGKSVKTRQKACKFHANFMARHYVARLFSRMKTPREVFGFTYLSNYICQIVTAVISRDMGRLAKVTLEKCAINGRERQCGCGRTDGRTEGWATLNLHDSGLRKVASSGHVAKFALPNFTRKLGCGFLKRTIGGGGKEDTALCRYFFQFFSPLVNERKESSSNSRLPDRVETNLRETVN